MLLKKKNNNQLNMKHKVLILFLVITCHSFSQVAGYLGKRFAIGYDVYVFPAFKGPGLNDAGNSAEFSLGFNNVHCINLDYTIKQRTNLCFTFQHLKTGIAYRGGDGDGLGELFTKVNYPGGLEYGGNFSIPAQLSSYNIGVGFKFFRSGEIAPVGKYRKLELLLFFETVTYNNKKFVDYNTGPISKAGPGTYNYNSVALAYTIGRQHVFFNELVLDYGVRLGITSYIFTAAAGILNEGNNLSSNPTLVLEDSFRKDAGSRLFREQLFNLHIGLGFLAF